MADSEGTFEELLEQFNKMMAAGKHLQEAYEKGKETSMIPNKPGLHKVTEQDLQDMVESLSVLNVQLQNRLTTGIVRFAGRNKVLRDRKKLITELGY